MRHYLILFSLLAINCLGTSTTKYLTKGNPKTKHIRIEIIKPVNGYKISILWYPAKKVADNQIVGPAILELISSLNNKKHTVHYESFTINYAIKNLKMSDELVESYSNSDFRISYEALEYKPFYFFDVNFDGIKDLVVAEFGVSSKYGLNKNKFFEITFDGAFTPINYAPFNDVFNFFIDNDGVGFRNGIFDVKKKEIIVTDVLSAYKSIDHIYRRNGDKSATKNKFIEIRTEDNDWQTKEGYDIIVIHIPGKKDQTKIVKSNQ